MPTQDKAPARPAFRKLAYAVAAGLAILAALVAFAPVEERAFTAGVCLLVAFVMLTIGATGYWPPPRRR